MSSNINPSNINGSYPVAGQDNDSQGFRDNFTNIRNNLTYTKSEIEDLQNKVVLTAPLTGSTSTIVTNNLSGVGLTGAVVAEFTELANVNSDDTVTNMPVDFTKGHLHQYSNLIGSVVLDLNWGAVVSGQYAKMRLWVKIPNTSYTVTFPASVTVGLDRILGMAGHLFTAPTVGEYVFEFSTVDAGSNVVISPVSAPVTVIEQGTDVVLPGNAASISTAVTTFSTTVASTATLSAGREDQVKSLVATSIAGNMVFTVANPGWGGLGHITFATTGSACTLRYVSGKWYCTGNNGAAFA